MVLPSPQFLTRRRWKGGLIVRNVSVRNEELFPFFQALETSPDPVFVTDRRNRIVFWNPAVRHLLGFTEDDTVGVSCDQLLGGCDGYGNRYCSDDCPIMRMANRGESVHNFSLTLRAKDESTVVATMTVLQLRGFAPDEYFLAHVVRTDLREPARATTTETAPAAPPPRPHLVSARESADARARKLTSREVEVLAMLAAGRSTPEIAERLHISQLTARSHIQNILEKLEVHSKAEAVAFAFQKNLI